VVEKLAQEREARRERRVVRVVDALRRVGDERDRIGQIITRVHRSARRAEFGQRVADQLRVGRERWQRRKQTAEAALVVEGGLGRVLLANPHVTVRHLPTSIAVIDWGTPASVSGARSA